MKTTESQADFEQFIHDRAILYGMDYERAKERFMADYTLKQLGGAISSFTSAFLASMTPIINILWPICEAPPANPYAVEKSNSTFVKRKAELRRYRRGVKRPSRQEINRLAHAGGMLI